MPFGKAKSRKSTHHQEMKHDENGGQKQDEFLHYFRQHRHPSALPQEEPPYNRYSSNRRFMKSPVESDYEFGSCYSSLGRVPNSPSSVSGLLPSPPPPPPAKRHPLSPNGGLGELSGMLADKMSFGNGVDKMSFANGVDKMSFGNGVDALTRRRNVVVDDAQSRDSGHLTGSSAATNSSSESPRYRPGDGVLGRFRDSYGHLLRRRPPPPKQLSLDSAERHYTDHARRPLEWNIRNGRYHGDDRNSIYDRNSVYSYNTAVDEQDSGVSGDSVVSYMDYNPIRHYNRTIHARTNGFGDSVSVQSGHTGTLFADLDDNDDEMSNTASWSPWMSTSSSTSTMLRQRQIDNNKSVDYSQMSFDDNSSPDTSLQRQSTLPEKSAVKEEPAVKTFHFVLSSFFLFLKFFVSVGCCTLLCLALFVASRSLSCRWSGHQKMDVSTLDAVLKANVIGQNLAVREIVDSIGDFYNRPADSKSSVLVLYLLGWVGTGKTLTSSLLKSQFPVSSNVHVFSVPVHFASGLNSRNNLHVLDDLAEHVKRSCGYSMVVFEDIEPETMSPAVSGHLSKFILTLNDHRSGNGTIVVVTSNAGGQAINKKLFDVANSHSDASELLSYRDRVTTSDVIGALDETESRIPMLETLVSNGVTIRIVPFLPLTRDHVRQCIVRDLLSSGASVNGAEVNAILDDLSFFSENFPVFSKTGCKKVSAKVDLLLGNRHTFLGLA